MSALGHYDERYFAWQRNIGLFGGWANRQKFDAWIQPGDRVLDFGCGGGYLLAGLSCREKIGIEPNPAAREEAAAQGLHVVANTAEVPDAWADVIISNHALEHVEHPLTELRNLHSKLKPGGVIVVAVPCEYARGQYQPGDVNHHLYSWGPMALGNLLSDAGFAIERSTAYPYKWPPFYRQVARLLGNRGFDLACRLYSRLDRRSGQVRAVAYKQRVG